MKRARSREDGFTMIELLVAIGLGGIVLGTMVGAVTAQGRSAAYQKGLADAQLAARGSGELFLQDLRMTGYGMLGVSSSAALSPLEYSAAGTTQTVTLRGAYGNVQTTLKQGAVAGSSNIIVDPPSEGSFVVGEMILIDSGLSSEIRTISGKSTSGGDLVLNLDTALVHQYPLGPSVTQLEEITWELEDGLLRRNDAVVAENVEGFLLQFLDQAGEASSEPGEDLRSVTIQLRTIEPSRLADNHEASSEVDTEVNLRNLGFRFSLG